MKLFIYDGILLKIVYNTVVRIVDSYFMVIRQAADITGVATQHTVCQRVGAIIR